MKALFIKNSNLVCSIKISFWRPESILDSCSLTFLVELVRHVYELIGLLRLHWISFPIVIETGAHHDCVNLLWWEQPTFIVEGSVNLNVLILIVNFKYRCQRLGLLLAFLLDVFCGFFLFSCLLAWLWWLPNVAKLVSHRLRHWIGLTHPVNVELFWQNLDWEISMASLPSLTTVPYVDLQWVPDFANFPEKAQFFYFWHFDFNYKVCWIVSRSWLVPFLNWYAIRIIYRLRVLKATASCHHAS